MNYVIIGNVYKVYKNNDYVFAAKVICENETHIQFENSKGVRTILAKSVIRELADLGKPRINAAGDSR